MTEIYLHCICAHYLLRRALGGFLVARDHGLEPLRPLGRLAGHFRQAGVLLHQLDFGRALARSLVVVLRRGDRCFHKIGSLETMHD